MPPGGLSVMRTSGAKGADDVKTTGYEIFTVLGFHRNKLLLVFAFICSAAAGAVNFVIIDSMGGLVDSLSGGGTVVEGTLKMIKTLAWGYGVMVGTLCLSILLRVIANAPFLVDLRKKIYDIFMNIEIDYFDKNSTGVMVSRISEDCVMMKETYVDKACQVVQNVVQAIGGVVYSFTVNWIVSLIAIGVVVLIAIVFVVSEKMIEKLWTQYSSASSANTSKAEEIISQFRIVKSFDCEMLEFEEYEKGLDQVDTIFRKTSVAHGFKNGAIAFLTNGLIAGLIYLGSYLIIFQNDKFGLEVGDLIALFMGSFFIVMGVTNAVTFVDDFRKANIAAQLLFALFLRKPEVERHEGNDLPPVKGSIEFQNVYFKYSTRDDYAIKNMSLTINAGETVAFVGESGCGKTTTIQLIQRFYELESGRILIDGIDIKTVKPISLRHYISAVPQSPVLYSLSVKDNILYGNANATDTEVADAATVGNAHNFIMNLPKNYETTVHQTSLSGGQKQRICISRAILADSPILLLDEATAALDTESEQLVQQSLEKVRNGKTCLIVAHRLATVMNADRIFVVANGRIIEEGTHQELLDKNGVYKDLVTYQLQ